VASPAAFALAAAAGEEEEDGEEEVEGGMREADCVCT